MLFDRRRLLIFVLGGLVAIFALAVRAQAQVVANWMVFSDWPAEAITGLVRGPILGTAINPTVSTPIPWVGAATLGPTGSSSNGLGVVVGHGTDVAGNAYEVHNLILPDPVFSFGYVSKTSPAGAVQYFKLQSSPKFALISPNGDVFIQIDTTGGFSSVVYRLNPDGTLATVASADTYSSSLVSVGSSFFTLTAQEDVILSVSIRRSLGGGGVAGRIIAAATGLVPYLTKPLLPTLSALEIPLSVNPTVSLAASATSALPISYQWSRDGVPIPGANQSSYTGPIDRSATFTVTATTTGGTVSDQAPVNLTVGGRKADPTPTFFLVPTNVTITSGSSATLSATAYATLPVNFQWLRNGTPIAGATLSQMSATTFGSYETRLVATEPGVYTVSAFSSESGSNPTLSPQAQVTVIDSNGNSIVAVPRFFSQPRASAFLYGQLARLTASAGATLPLSYQWQLNGVDIAGATSSTYETGVTGIYTVVANTGAGSVTSDPVTVSLANRPANISSRVQVGTGADVGIAGFVVASYSGATKRVLIRGVGPSLSQLGVTGVVSRPVLTLFDAKGQPVASNSGWQDAPDIAAAAKSMGAFPFLAGSADSALLLDLTPGAYTAQISGANGGTGVALVEVYETTADSGHLVNISTRGRVGVGEDILIGGVVVSGTQPSRVLIRAVGPGLKDLGVSGAMERPTLALYNGAGLILAGNVGWSNSTSTEIVTAINYATLTGAFPLTLGSADCVIVATLAPGNYTIHVAGANQSTGIALVEVYQVPQ